MSSVGGSPKDGAEPGMWQQFRRRRVTRTVFLYLTFGFAAIEAYLYASTLAVLPAWGLRAVVGAVVLGFPITVVLAWTYDVTPRGIVKTPEDLEPEPPPLLGSEKGWLIAGVVAVAAGLLLELIRR